MTVDFMILVELLDQNSNEPSRQKVNGKALTAYPGEPGAWKAAVQDCIAQMKQSWPYRRNIVRHLRAVMMN